MKVNILGAEYEVIKTTDKEDLALRNINGYCDSSVRKIVLETEYDENDPTIIKDCDSFKRKVARHECIHAYFNESGLYQYCENELLVDWIATQFPKMVETFKELDIEK